jgi:hypothetical protein
LPNSWVNWVLACGLINPFDSLVLPKNIGKILQICKISKLQILVITNICKPIFVTFCRIPGRHGIVVIASTYITESRVRIPSECKVFRNLYIALLAVVITYYALSLRVLEKNECLKNIFKNFLKDGHLASRRWRRAWRRTRHPASSTRCRRTSTTPTRSRRLQAAPKSSAHWLRLPRVDVVVTIFCYFCQLWRKNGVFLKNQ